MDNEQGEQSPPAERRLFRRREDDQAQAAIVDGAVQVTPIVQRLLHTGKVAAALTMIGVFVGGVGAALGQRIAGPSDDIRALAELAAHADSLLDRRIDSTQSQVRINRLRQDSVLQLIAAMRSDLQFQSYTQCILLRRFAPDLRPQGCDAAERRGGAR